MEGLGLAVNGLRFKTSVAQNDTTVPANVASSGELSVNGSQLLRYSTEEEGMLDHAAHLGVYSIGVQIPIDRGIPSMTDQKVLSEALALALRHIKALHGTLAASLLDVAALRQVVLNSPKKSRRYRQVIAAKAAKVKPLVATAMQAYEEEILHIKAINHWLN